MKKFIILLVLAFTCIVCYTQPVSNSEEELDTKIEVYKIKDVYSNAGSQTKITCTAYYYPLYHEVRMEYISPMTEYTDEDYAAIMRCILLNFTKQLNFYHYIKLTSDERRFFKTTDGNKYIKIFVYAKLLY